MNEVQTPQASAPQLRIRPKRRKENLLFKYGCLGTLAVMMLICLMCSGMLGLFFFLGRPDLFIIANILAFTTAIPYCLLLLWLDRNEPEPLHLIITALVWGAFVSTVVSMMFNDTFSMAVTELVGDPFIADALTASISAPFIEELSKGLAVLFIFMLFKNEFDNVLDGIIYGALVGLGFATIENVIYYFDVGSTGGYGEMLKLTWVRGILGGIGSHAAYTGLCGAGFGLVRVLRKGYARWLLVPLFWGMAMFAHFIWNTFCGFFIFSYNEGVTYLVSLPLAVMVLEMPFVLLLFITVAFVWRQENRVILQYLSDEQEDILTDDLRKGMVPARRRVWTGVGRFFKMGPSRWWHHRRLERDLIELSFAKWHLAEDPELTWSPEEDADVLELRTNIRKRWKKLGRTV
jgi:protease PrsW